MNWTTGVRSLAEAGISSPRHRVQTGPGAHPASYSMNTGGFFPRDQATGASDRQLHLQLVSNLRMSGATPPLNSTSSQRGAS